MRLFQKFVSVLACLSLASCAAAQTPDVAETTNRPEQTQAAQPFVIAANPLGEGNCLACGAPMGDAHPTACTKCGFVIGPSDQVCPNCNQKLF